MSSRNNLRNWRTFLRPGSGAVFLLAGFLCVTYLNGLPAREVSFWGLPLGGGREDVRFFKGAPDSGNDGSDTWVYFDKHDGLSNGGRSGRDDSRHTIQFHDGRIWIVLCYNVVGLPGSELTNGLDGRISLSPCTNGQSLQGLRGGSEVQQVVATLGRPGRILSHDGGFERVYVYPELNSVFILKEGKVWFYGTYDPDLGQPGLSDFPLLAALKAEREDPRGRGAGR